jgi:KaiC/GvpD/RAD55 family RecA-like ATPase
LSILRDAALEYREAGLHPIPIHPRSKRPAIASWKQYQDTMPTVDEIEAWWTVMPDANIALILGRGMFAVDVDGPEGEQALTAAGIDLSGHPRSKTSKGYHVFLAGQEIPNRVNMLPKVDIRGEGGYVVVAPSVHESGHVYAWETPIEGVLKPGPERLYDLIRGKTPPATLHGADWFTQALVGVAEGGRDATCTRLAGRLLGAGLPQEAVDLILQSWAERCVPPFSADQVSKCVESIARREGAPEGPPDTLQDLVESEMLLIHNPEKRKRPVSTGIGGLNDVLGDGLYPGEYAILGARPSVGKTAFALQIARELGRESLIISLEMGKGQLVRRLLSQAAQVNAQAIRTGKLDAMQMKLLEFAAPILGRLPIRITTDVQTTGQLENLLQTYTPGVLQLVVVDYVQLLQTDGAQYDSRQRIGSISRALRRMANQYEVPILALSQLTRPPKDHGRVAPDWEPEISDLMESGELEAGADIVMLMTRKRDERATKLRVGKNRDGATGDVALDFSPHILTFREVK